VQKGLDLVVSFALSAQLAERRDARRSELFFERSLGQKSGLTQKLEHAHGLLIAKQRADGAQELELLREIILRSSFIGRSRRSGRRQVLSDDAKLARRG